MHYRWVVLATSFMILAVAFGIQYSFGVFFSPLQDAFGWSRAAISWAMTFHLLVFGLVMVPVGWTVSRIGIRRMLFVAALLVGSSLSLSSRISAPWQLYLLYGLPLGIGVAICGPAVIVNVAGWFTEKRGLALGIATAGTGMGTLAAAPLASMLIRSYGWRDSYAIVGLLSCVILLVCAFFTRNAPTLASNAGAISVGSHTSPGFGLVLKQAVKVRSFWLLTIAQSLASFRGLDTTHATKSDK